MSKTLYKVQTIDVFCDKDPLPRRALMFTTQDHCEVVLFPNDRPTYDEKRIVDSTYNRTTVFLTPTKANQFSPLDDRFTIDDQGGYKLTSENHITKDGQKNMRIPFKAPSYLASDYEEGALASTLIFEGSLYDWYGREIKAEKNIKQVIAYFDTSMYGFDPHDPQTVFSYEYYIVELSNGKLSLAYLDYNKTIAKELFNLGSESGYVITAKTTVLCKPKLKKIKNNFFFRDFMEFTTSEKPILRKIAEPLSSYSMYEKSPRFALFDVTNGKTKEKTLLVYGIQNTIEENPSSLLPASMEFLVFLDSNLELEYGRFIIPPNKLHIKDRPTFSNDGNIMTINCTINSDLFNDEDFDVDGFDFLYDDIIKKLKRTKKIRLSMSVKSISQDNYDITENFRPWYYDPET